MKEYKSLHGFKFVKAEVIPELNSTLVTYLHEKTDMPLFFSDRKDKNKTFAIGFRTVPTDDTGVFHILEHSILSGSEKYPAKDPFTQMLKSSVSTYLNALTYPDRTVYPVSSKNEKAFFDLMDVYLDAVFHPLALKNKNIFLSEGHRLEIDENGEVSVNGVVYNEMQGAYASVEEYASYHIDRLLYPDGCYGYDSGGHPDSITSLTYEQFCEAHRKFYHPSGAFVFLDGSVNLDKVLELIDSYITEYSRAPVCCTIEKGADVITEEKTGYHPEVEEGKCDLHLAVRYDRINKDELFALNAIEDVIASSNSSRLKKKILDTGLCENFYFYLCSGVKYPSVRARFTGVTVGYERQLVDVYHDELKKIASEGLSPDALNATLNSIEFRARESDFGNFPKGMVIMTSVFEAAAQGEEPSSGLYYLDSFKKARERVGTDYYSALIEDILNKSEARFTVYRKEVSGSNMPSPVLSEEEKEAVKEENKALAQYQNTEDSEEALATLPRLKISDLEMTFEKTPTDEAVICGAKALIHPLATEGISYFSLYFDVSDAEEEHLPLLSLLASSYSDFDTERHSCAELADEIKTHLGNLSVRLTRIRAKSGAKLYFTFKLATLDSKKDDAVRLFKEYVSEIKFDTVGVIDRRIKQISAKAGSILAENGHAIGLTRASAMHEVSGVISELTTGYTFLKKMKELSRTEGSSEMLAQLYASISKKYFTKKRALCSLIGIPDADFVERLISDIPEGDSASLSCKLSTLPKRDEAIITSSPVGYAVFTSNLADKGEGHTGALFTMNSILTYEILWDAIRIKGGAYDTGIITGGINSGTLGFYSYRDPSTAKSRALFAKGGSLLREFLDTVPDIDEYIVGAYGQYDTITTPRTDGNAATEFYLCEIEHAERVECRRQTIETTKEELYRLADLLDGIAPFGTSVLVTERATAESLDGVSILEEL